MKTPPFLLLATLLFWGWQSGFLIVGVVMGVILESARYVRWRWDLDDSDFNRIFTFCLLLVMLLAGYVFTTNDEGGVFTGFAHGDGTREVLNSSLVSFTRFLRWLPMTFFAFILAQTFNVRDSVPLTSVSHMLRWRRRKGEQTFAGRFVNFSYPYFIFCLFSAGIHLNAGTHTYFWGQGFLVAWALWGLRSKRFAAWTWFLCLILALGLGFSGQIGISLAQTYIQNFNASWMSKFFRPHTDALQSITSMGQIGQLKLSAEIIAWLEPREVGRVPSYLREASYRLYQPSHQAWLAGIPRTDFQPVLPEPDGISWTLMSSKTNPMTAPARVNIACYLTGWSQELSAPEGLLPLPTGCRRLENTPENMIFKKNRNGSVLASGIGVLFFDAIYGGGATIDSPPDTGLVSNRLDLITPPNERPALDQVIAEMNFPTNADLQTQLRTIDRYFLNNFKYSTWQGPDKDTNTTPLTKFLLKNHSGHCEYFATATVLLLRELNIPARYAVGYAVHETSGTGYVVRERDSHAWCMVWDKSAHCWEDFDTTPPSWIGIESKRTAFMEWFADLKSWLRFQLAAFRWRQAHLQQYIFWALVPVMVVLLYHIIFRRRGKNNAKAKGDRGANVIWPGLDSEFYQLEKKLVGFGLVREAGEPLTRWLERLSADPALAGSRETFQKLLRLHYRHRFDPRGLSATERGQLRTEVKTCLDSLLIVKAG